MMMMKAVSDVCPVKRDDGLCCPLLFSVVMAT